MIEEQVRARVESFIVDFHETWLRSGRMTVGFPSPEFFAAWKAELAHLTSRHCTADARGVDGSLSSSPAHEPGAERITDVHVAENRARVRSEIGIRAHTTYYEYRLVRVDEQWRIEVLRTYFDPPGAPLVDSAEAERLLGSVSPDAALRPISPRLQLDLPSLFAEGRRVTPFDEEAALEVHRLGDFTTTSGVLSVRDFGYGNHELEPLARPVPPGTYPVEVSRADHTNLALRLRLSEERPTAEWFRADRVFGGGHVAGVDYANVTILDLGALVGCEAQQVEELWEAQISALVEGPGTAFTLTGEANDAVMAESGMGDGAYPCYWGVAADGTLTELVVDFLVLVESLGHAVTVPWQLGRLEAPGLVEHAFEVEDRGDVFVLSHDAGPVERVQVMVPGGRVYMDTERLGVMVSGGRRSYRWPTISRPPAKAVVTVKIGDGYRHT